MGSVQTSGLDPFAGPGEMRARCRAFDWASTPFGPVDAWPPHLRTAASMVLSNGFSMVLHYGPAAVQLYNDACIPSLGSEHPNALGRPLFDSFPETRASVEPLHARVYNGETVTLVHQGFPVSRGGGIREAFFTFSYSPLVSESGETVGVVVTALETTAQVEAEAARIDADAANRTKADFLATMSHELRTPLNAIGGYAELMELGIRGPITEEQRSDLRRIQASQRHLLGLVNEVLDLARIDSGELELDVTPVRAGDTVDAALSLVRPQATLKALQIAEADGGALERAYLGDEPRVRQVLVNLLANAVKFTATGGEISVKCELSESPPAQTALASRSPYVVVHVRDNGVGIAPDQLTRIFEPFTQAEGGLTRTRGGTGLGLAISRRLARLMGGEITVQSSPRAGSTFSLWLATPDLRSRPRDTNGTGPHADTDSHVVPAARNQTLRAPLTPPRPMFAVPVDEALAVIRVGDLLIHEVQAVIDGYVARLHDSAAIPTQARSIAELEDHCASFVLEIALALRTMGDATGESAARLRDGTAIMALVAERHGAQRAGMGWSEDAIHAEFRILDDVLRETVHRTTSLAHTHAQTAARISTIVAQLLEQGKRLSISGYRLARSME